MMTDKANMYKLLFNEARDGIWIINPLNKTIIDVNKSLTELSGYAKEQLLAMSPQDISPDPEGTAEIMKRALVSGGEIFQERKMKKEDGTIIPVEISARSVMLDGQKVIIGIFRDISERKKAEAEKVKLIEKLEKALEEVKKLSGLLPICASCKKIRDDKGYWNQLEGYIQKHSEAKFSHSLCPECSDKIYGNEDWYLKLKEKDD